MVADSREDGLVISVPQVITGLYPPLEIEFQTPLPGDLRQTGGGARTSGNPRRGGRDHPLCPKSDGLPGLDFACHGVF